MTDESSEPTKEGDRAALQLKHMLRAGRSWSGRERHCVYLNTGGHGRFADVSATSGLDLIDDGRGLAMTDWDADGDLDLWISNRNAPQLRFLRNDAAGGSWIALRLVGDGERTNRDAVGARVAVTVAGTRQAERQDAARRRRLPGPVEQVASLRAGGGRARRQRRGGLARG